MQFRSKTFRSLGAMFVGACASSWVHGQPVPPPLAPASVAAPHDMASMEEDDMATTPDHDMATMAEAPASRSGVTKRRRDRLERLRTLFDEPRRIGHLMAARGHADDRSAPDARHTVFVRAEQIDDSELLEHGQALGGETFRIRKYSFGYIHDFATIGTVRWGVGGLIGFADAPSRLDFRYGSAPRSYMVFVQGRL